MSLSTMLPDNLDLATPEELEEDVARVIPWAELNFEEDKGYAKWSYAGEPRRHIGSLNETIAIVLCGLGLATRVEGRIREYRMTGDQIARLKRLLSEKTT